MGKKVSVFGCTKPCGNCPYRTDAPLRYWDKFEFQKLLIGDSDPFGNVFNCHKNNGSICIGWLMDQESRGLPNLKLRMLLSKYSITRQYLDSLRSPVKMYPSIQAMIKANYPSLLINRNTRK